jgi:cytochrome c biogenesis protein CcmG/thiol:disulfide interchange protein DsbE
MRRIAVILPVLLLALLVGVMAALLTDTERNNDPSRLPSPLVGKPAPAIALPGIDGGLENGFSTADLLGRASVVNVFASWCVPCLAEHPLITRLADDGVPVFGINHRDRAEDARAWLARHGNPYTAVGFDADARTSLEWGVTGVPETFIIDRNGTIAFKHTGPLTADVLEDTILPKLREAEGG